MQTKPYILVLFAGLALSGTAQAAPIGSSETLAAASARQILLADPTAASGFYWFDPDGSGSAVPFMTYADMTTDGGGWMLGMHSLHGSEAPSTDMAANLGDASLSNGFTRNLAYWAIDQPAELRHVITSQDGSVLLDAYYTGRYHDALPHADAWTILTGTFSAASLDYHLGLSWSTSANDLDTWSGNCAASFGQPWYYGACWAAHPTGYTWNNGPYAQAGSMPLASYDIYVRELQTPPPPTHNIPEPGTFALLAMGALTLARMRRREDALPRKGPER